jgi:hypothetical protein
MEQKFQSDGASDKSTGKIGQQIGCRGVSAGHKRLVPLIAQPIEGGQNDGAHKQLPLVGVQRPNGIQSPADQRCQNAIDTQVEQLVDVGPSGDLAGRWKGGLDKYRSAQGSHRQPIAEKRTDCRACRVG